MLFGQLTACNGLRDIYLCLCAHSSNLYHLDIKKGVEQSTLSRANGNRDWRIFAILGAYHIGLVSPMYTDFPIPGVEADNDVIALNSPNISMSLVLMARAIGKYSRGAVKMHTLLDLRGISLRSGCIMQSSKMYFMT